MQKNRTARIAVMEPRRKDNRLSKIILDRKIVRVVLSVPPEYGSQSL